MTTVTETKIHQMVSRRRRSSDPQLPYPEYWDEYYGSEPTGKIITGYKNGEFSYLDVDMPSSDSSSSDSIATTESTNVKDLVKKLAVAVGLEIEKEIVPKTRVVYLVDVIHYYGTNSMMLDYEFNQDEYRKELDAKYWPGFVEKLRINELKIAE